MPKRNFKLTIQYLGTSYNGWQYQPNCSTVQGEIEDAFKKILHKNKQDINLVGSGRTDSGVHAIGQVANIIINTNILADDLKNAINANISDNIFIKDCLEVNLEFNSRFSAIKREYYYRIITKYNPINRNYNWFLNHDINIPKLNSCSKLILGDNDFSAFCKETSLKENN